MSYVKVPQCRICSKVDDSIRESIDSELISGESFQNIILRYGDKFPEEHPLTESSLANHKRHLTEYLAVANLEALKKEDSGKLVLVPEIVERKREVDKFLAKTSLEVARGIVNQDDMLQALIIDSFRDVEALNEQISSMRVNTKLLRQMIMTKDSVKKNLIDTIQRSQELRQKVGGDIDKAQAVKEAIRRVLSACVKSLKAIAVTQEEANLFSQALKEYVLKDPIISKYLEDEI